MVQIYRELRLNTVVMSYYKHRHSPAITIINGAIVWLNGSTTLWQQLVAQAFNHHVKLRRYDSVESNSSRGKT